MTGIQKRGFHVRSERTQEGGLLSFARVRETTVLLCSPVNYDLYFGEVRGLNRDKGIVLFVWDFLATANTC